jgi:hypothetical protein
MFDTIPQHHQKLAERVASRESTLNVELAVGEFDAYVVALTMFWRKAADGRADYAIRMQALDVLHGVRKRVHGDSVDSTHLRSCWKARRIAASWDEGFSIGLIGPAGRSIVLALGEFSQSKPETISDAAMRTWAAGMLYRITAESAR